MFRKFIKKSFLFLAFLSYATTTLPMEPQEPQLSLWQRVKNRVNTEVQSWTNPVMQEKIMQSEVPNSLLATNASLYNFRFVLGGLLGLYESFFQDRSKLTNLADIEMSSEFPKEKAIIIKDILLNTMRLSPQTKVMSRISRYGSVAAAAHNFLLIDTTLDNLFTMDEQKGVLSHEGGHIKNKDEVKAAFVSLALPALSFGIIKGYQWGSNKLLRYLYSKYPSIRKPVTGCKRINDIITSSPLTYYLISAYLYNLYSRHCEYNADYESAVAVGSAPLISCLKKMEDPVFVKKFTKIAIERSVEGFESSSLLGKLFETASQIDHLLGMPSHPSNKDRIKALEMLQKK